MVAMNKLITLINIDFSCNVFLYRKMMKANRKREAGGLKKARGGGIPSSPSIVGLSEDM